MMASAVHVTGLITAVRAAGGIIRRDGDMIELAARAPLPPDLIARIREAKSALLMALADGPSDWHARHREALAYWSAFRPPDEAARLAWGELQNRWHWLHGGCLPEWQCAGCGEPIGGVLALELGDGNRAHLDRLDCLLRYGERWRVAATRSLVATGLQAPAQENER
jgi:hypothetical protein